ncbi:MAG TPA: cytochrome c3 family protein [Chthoniobacterales bacterium]|jgi:predicted CXXCH cytochrome family protein
MRPVPIANFWAIAAASAAIAGIGLLIHFLTPDYAAVNRGRMDAGYLLSGDCRKCHAQNYDTWYQTFHRTMTRDANAKTILGDFEKNNTVTYQGVRAEMVREDGDYWMKLTGADGKKQNLKVVRTVGSRRIQQYLTKSADKWMRLPVAYDLIHRRWMHLNGSFFNPDGTPYSQHLAEWNANCVFCHNVKAQPGFDWNKQSWNTEVAELGVACGACHGPAGKHAEQALSPITRYRWHLNSESAPPTAVVNPAKFDSDRATMICAHCHGQRLPQPEDRIRSILSEGDPFNAGEDLHAFYRPVQRETKVGSFSFSTRFWADGSPRLTAYEYQGMTRSRCFTGGKPGARISCISCHEMHGGDPRGMITAKMRTNAACTQCHEQFTTTAQLVAHTKHNAESAGSICYNCHMPRIVYGVMSSHPTHEITTPRPEDTIRFDKPNACNQCHLDWSANRAIAATKQLWPKEYVRIASGGDRFDEPEGRRALFAGDAVMRALTAAAMMPANNLTAPWLLEATQDRYPIVRYFAANDLAASEPMLPKPDYLATSDEREATLQSWYGHWSPAQLEEARAARKRLSIGRAEVDVEVGE